MFEVLKNMLVDLQLFAEAGTAVNATATITNAYTGATEARSKDAGTDMSMEMKTYYDTEMLQNTRAKLIFHQLGKKQHLPAHHGRTVEWRKWNKLPDIRELQEGVIPTGLKLGATDLSVTLKQYGDFVAVTDILDLHAIDPVILGAQDELSAAASLTMDKLDRAVLVAETNVMYADKVAADGTKTAVDTRADLIATGGTTYFTPDTVAKAVTVLRKLDAPFYSGSEYMAIIHPSCVYDLRSNKDWIEAHKYFATTQIFNGEIGSLHGVRFIESTLAPIVMQGTKAVYQILMFGKDAFAVVDPEGAGMRTIVKGREQVGGPLEQFSTVGVKTETAAKVLYPDRLIRIECTSTYSDVDKAN